MSGLCPYFPEQPKVELKCDYLAKKQPEERFGYSQEFCKGRFADCSYYFHLSNWMQRMKEALRKDKHA